MKKTDARMQATTESLNNIKMLKLYAWTDVFKKFVKEKREEEMDVLWDRFKLGSLIVSSLYFFPQLQSAVVFSCFIAAGNVLSLETAFTVTTFLNLIKDPLRTLPLFVGQWIEFTVSMNRI